MCSGIDLAVKLDRAHNATECIRRVLVIDDEPIIAELLRDVFVRHDFEVETCFGGEAGLEHAVAGHFDLVVSDFAMPGMNGLDLALRLAIDDPQAKIVIVSAFLDADFEERLIRQRNVGAILRKPFDIHELVRVADQLTRDPRRPAGPRTAARTRDDS